MAAALPAIAGSVAGALISKSGSKGSTSSVQTAEPWSGVQPHLRTMYDAALSNFSQGGPQYYPNQTVAPQGPVTGIAQNELFGRATHGNELLPTGQQAAQSTLNDDYMWGNPAMLGQLFMSQGGDAAGMDQLMQIGGGSMLNANPYVDDMFNNAASRVGEQFSKYVMPGVTSMFAGAGRYGSNQHAEGLGAAQGQFGDMLNRLATSIYGGNYANERGLQQQALNTAGQFDLQGRSLQQGALDSAGTMFGRERVMQGQAAGMSPELSQADYFDIAQLMGLGGQQDAYSQSLLNSDIARWDFNQQAPNESLSFLNNILSGASAYKGGTTTGGSQQPYSPLAGMLGGARLGSMFSSPQPTMYSPGGMAGSGFGSGTAFGNQDLGLFL